MSQRRFRSPHAVLCAALCASLAGACHKADQALSPTTWAVVNGQTISRDDVEKVFRASVDPATVPSDEEVLTAKLSIVDDLINQHILAARAAEAKLEPTDAEVDKALADRKAGAADAQFELQLSQRNLTVDDLKKGIRRELAVNKLLDRDVTQKATPSEEDITAFFTAHRAEFNYAEPQYRIAQIVITPGRDGVSNRMNDDAATPDEAKRKTDMLLERLKSGAEFASLAMDYSEDPQSVSRGGDLGFLPASAFARAPKAIRDAVVNGKPGAINMVTANGTYTILLLIASEPAGQREISTPSVHDGVRNLLQQRKEQLLRLAYIASARDDAQIVNNLAKLIVEGQGKIASK
jgi:peptidyl-prolyl cis-trans isomerase SurA